MTTDTGLLRLLWQHRVTFASIVGAALLLAVLFIALSTPLYRAEAVVAPIGAAGRLAGLSTVTNLVGLSDLDLGNDVQRFAIFRYLLHSPELARTLPASDEILKAVFHEQWDAKAATWRGPGMLGSAILLIKGIFGETSDWRPPDYRNLSEHMRERLSISDVGTTGLVRLSFDHEEAETAARILSEYLAGGDDLLRVQERTRKVKERDYLMEKLQDATISEVRLALATLIGSTEQELVLLNTNQPVAYNLVQPVVLHPNPVYPRPLLFLLLGGAFGVVVAVSYVLLKASRSRQ